MDGETNGLNTGKAFFPERDGDGSVPGRDLSETCRRVLAAQATACCIRSGDFSPVYANPAYLRLFGLTLEDWKKAAGFEHLGPDAARFAEEEIVPALARGQAWKGELAIAPPRAEPARVAAEFSPVHDEGGAPTHYVALFLDLPPLRRPAPEPHDQAAFLNSIIDALPDPIFVKDSNHAWVVVNEAFCALTGHSREDLLGRTDHDFFPKEQADLFWKQDDKALQGGLEVANEEVITGRNGTVRKLATRKVCLSRPDGEKIVVGMARDITDQRRLERDMAQSYNQLEKALASLRGGLGQFQRAIASEAAKADAIQGLIGRSNEFFRDFLEQTGAPPVLPEPARQDRAHLSPREYQVTLLLAKGHRIKDVAEHLGLNPNTVSTYRARIMRKLDLASNTDLIQYALRNGLL